MLLFHTLTLLLISILISFIITFPVTNILYKYRIVRSGEFDDTFSQIPSHKEKEGVPIMGGVIIIATIVIVTFIWNLSRSYTLVPISVLLVCAIIGALDDLMNIYGRKRPIRKLRHTIRLALHHAKPMKRVYFGILIPWTAYKSIFYTFGSRLGTGLHPHEKVLVQGLAGAIIAYWMYFKIHQTSVWLPGNISLDIGWFLIPLVIFMVIFMANAVNITDGLDGLSTGILIPAFLAFMVIAFNLRNYRIADLCATTVGALLTYLYFNIKPARFQMGDVGSLALGAMLASISIILQRELLLVLAGGLFFIEIFSVIIQKYAKKLYNKKIFMMTPIHHHFELKGWSEEKVVMRFWVFAIICSIIAVWLSLL